MTLALAMSGGPDARAQGASAPPLAAGPMVAAGEGTSFLLKADGTVWSWGDQRDGRLGDGQDRDNSRTQPRPVLGLSAIRQIAIPTTLSGAEADKVPGNFFEGMSRSPSRPLIGIRTMVPSRLIRSAVDFVQTSVTVWPAISSFVAKSDP